MSGMDGLRNKWLDFTDRIARLDLPPFVKLGLLIAVAVLPFAAFVALQEDPEPDPDPVPVQRAIDTSQQIPLIFPFGGNPEVVEMSPSPDPTPTRSPAVTQCSNGRDDDRDGKVDLKDPGCSSRTDKSESPDPSPAKPPAPPAPKPPAPAPASPAAAPPAAPPPPVPPVVPPAPVSPSPTPSPSHVPRGQCDDGLDNDGDGKIDLDDRASCHGDPTEDE
jgi:hypothetical protein